MGEIDEAELLSAGQRGAVLGGLGWVLSSIFVLSLTRLSRST
jgi:hypothetical protein